MDEASRKLLFVTYGGGHVKMLVPVIKALARFKSLRIEVLGLTTARSVLAAEGIPSLGFNDFVLSGDEQALEWGRELSAGQSHPAVGEAESAAYMGLSFADMVHDMGEEKARAAMAAKGRAAFLPIRTIKRVLERVKPDLLITTNSPRAEQAAVLAARELGIPVLCLVDLFAIEEVKYMGQPAYGDCICVLDECVQARFLAAGRAPGAIRVTGNPAFDALAHPEVADAAAVIRGKVHGKKLILWVSQPEPAQHRITGTPGDPDLPGRILEALKSIVGRRPEWRLIVRPHPSENPAGFLPSKNVEISGRTDPLAPLLMAVDVVVCMTSTVGYEAALLGKPLIHLPLSIYSNEADYTEMGIALRVDDLQRLEMALHLILSQGWKPKIGLKHAGGATQAVVQAIVEMLPQGL
ncbi:MAG: UDP-glycosyltransferase [Pseudomonadota bacterium]